MCKSYDLRRKVIPVNNIKEFIRLLKEKMKDYLDCESDLPDGTHDEDIEFLFKELAGSDLI